MKISKVFVCITLLVVCLIAFGKSNTQAEVTVYDADGQFLGIYLGV
jgi:hypothetical protein